MDALPAPRAARVVGSLLLALAGALVIAPGAPAVISTDSVTVTVTGPGTITGPAGSPGDGINCAAGGSAANCSENYTPECDAGPHPVCVPQIVTLEATAQGGYALDWTGC